MNYANLFAFFWLLKTNLLFLRINIYMNGIDSMIIACYKAIFPNAGIKTLSDTERVFNMSMKIPVESAVIMLPALLLHKHYSEMSAAQGDIAKSQKSIAEHTQKITAVQIAPDSAITDKLSTQTKALYTACVQLSAVVEGLSQKSKENSQDFMILVQELNQILPIVANNFSAIKSTSEAFYST